MSDRASKFSLLVPVMDVEPVRPAECYPVPLVLWGGLAFCLTVWAIVIFAVTHFV